MTLTIACILSFFAGIGLTVFLFQEEIFNCRKIGYGENDIHPDYSSSCCRYLPPPNFPPPPAPPKKYGTQPEINALRGRGVTPPSKQ